jgi:hypothetical protein
MDKRVGKVPQESGGILMSELKAEQWLDYAGEPRPCYPKSEADKVIAELKGKLHDVSEILKETREWLIESQKLHKRCADNAVKVIVHQKYKRCTAMAEWCEATALWCYQAANTLPTGFHATLYGKRVMIEPDRLFKRHVLLTKWSAIWRELAEKFKPYKEADDGND